jgi:SOS response regulatory protein OraA/RecX
LSKKQIELNKEIADSDYDSVEERTVAEFKQSISNGVFNELGQDIHFLNQQLHEYEGLVQNLDFVDDEEFALVLVSNKKSDAFPNGDTKAELVIKDASIIDTVMLNQSKSMVDSIKAELREKHKPKSEQAKKAEALKVSKSELKAMEKVLVLGMKCGGVDKLMATLGDYQSGERTAK